MARKKKPSMPNWRAYRPKYKRSCDICGKRVSKKTEIWSYRNKKGVMEGRCRSHLKLRLTTQ